MTRAGRSRLAKVAGAVVGAIALLIVMVGVGAPLALRGERFGRLLAWTLPRMQGRIEIGGGRWSWRVAIALWRGRPATVALDQVRVFDPDGNRVLRLGHLSASVEVHRSPLQVTIRELRIEDADWVFVQAKGAKQAGFLAAFAPAGPPKPAATAVAASVVTIVGARLEGLTANFDFPTWGLVLRDVHGDAGLTLRGGPGVTAPLSFEVRGAEVAGGGQVRILGTADGFELPFSRGRLDRVVTSAEAPDAVSLDASAVTTGSSSLDFTGTFSGVYGISPASRAPGLRVEAKFAEASDAIAALTRSRRLGWSLATGPGARFVLDVDGTFDHPRGNLTLAAPALGRLEADAAFDGQRLGAGASFSRFRLAELLPPPIAPFLGGTLDGTVRGRFDVDGSVALDELSLLLTRPPNAGMPRTIRARAGAGRSLGPSGPKGWTLDLSGVRYLKGTIRLPRLAFGLRGGQITILGRIALRDAANQSWLPSPVLDLSVAGQGLTVESLFGVTLVRGGADFTAQARGPIRDLGIDVTLPPRTTLTVLGDRFVLPSQLPLRIVDDAVRFDQVRIEGPGQSTLDTSGRIGLDGRLGFGVVVQAFPVGELPGLAGTKLPIAGQISGTLRFTGAPNAPAVSGQLVFGAMAVQGRPVGGGAVAIAPGPRGAIHARGRFVEGISADGVLEPGPAGVKGEARLDLDHLRLDPFVPPLPGGFRAAGVLSGRVVARIAPGRAPEAEGALSELTVIVSPPPSRRQVHPIELHAEREIHLAARAGDGPIELGPARFRGNLGAFELWGERRGDALLATVRGRIELAPFAALTTPLFDHLAGSVDVDLAASLSGLGGRPSVSGSLSVSSPLAFQLSAFPVEARARSGRIVLRNSSLETKGFPISLRGEALASGAIRRLDAELRIDAQVGGLPDQPRGRAGVVIEQLVAMVPALGSQPVQCEQGGIAAESRGGELEIVHVDLPARGEVRGLSASGARIDRAAFALRLRGDPRRQLTLSGNVQLLGARISSQALGASKAGGKGGAGEGQGEGQAGWLSRPMVQNTALDLQLQSRDGAVVVDIPKLPDLRVNLDMHVGGTVKKPAVTGDPKGANAYSSLMLALGRLFR